ncbi:hypothetical protein G6F35_017388 [Rhizopus arrhizus]|nr:hypothetical protein G6F35_017388 [Rhizopus arrhizus]
MGKMTEYSTPSYMVMLLAAHNTSWPKVATIQGSTPARPAYSNAWMAVTTTMIRRAGSACMARHRNISSDVMPLIRAIGTALA